MTHQEMERTMTFILEQQAQFTANQQKHDEYFLRIEGKMDMLEDVVLKLAQSHIELVDSHKRQQEDQAESRRRLEAAQAETQERLNAFITFVEKYISSRNGGERAGH